MQSSKQEQLSGVNHPAVVRSGLKARMRLKFLIWCDHVWMLICSVWVRAAIRYHRVPYVGELLKRATFMSGSLDVNANVCLFMRLLYTQLPEAQRFDPAEVLLGYQFLQIQFKILFHLVTTFSTRLLPPLLRPLYVSYYGRAIETSRFIQQAICEREVKQIVILGAGYDTTAYRTRHQRIITTEDPLRNEPRFERYVKVFEVDLPRVQRRKLATMKQSMSPGAIAYYTEGVKYCECDFETQSLSQVLRDNKFNPSLPSAFLWEGVTYYLPLSAVKHTLAEIRVLLESATPVPASVDILRDPEEADTAAPSPMDYGSPPVSVPEQTSASFPSGDSDEATSASGLYTSTPKLELNDEQVQYVKCQADAKVEPKAAVRLAAADASQDDESAPESNEESVTTASLTKEMDPDTNIKSAKTNSGSYLMLDYMDGSKTLVSGRHRSWVWNLERKLTTAVGTPFVTGICNIKELLQEHGFQLIYQMSHEASTDMLRQSGECVDVMFEKNTTWGESEPRLAVVSAFFPAA